MSAITKVTKQDGKVIIEMPEALAPFVKVGVKAIGVKLAANDSFHTDARQSLSASCASIGLADVYDAMTQAGVYH